MRVGRALEKLRSTLHRSGIVIPAASLGATLAAHAVPALKPGFSATLATAALSPGFLSVTTATLLRSLELMT